MSIREALWRLIAKAILSCAKELIRCRLGPNQFAGGMPGGPQRCIAAIRACWERPEVEATLMLDGTNAFNLVSRPLSLRLVQGVLPAVACAVINSYREPNIKLRSSGGEGQFIFSKEGGSQGDPFAPLPSWQRWPR